MKKPRYAIRYAKAQDLPALMGLQKRAYPAWSRRNSRSDLRHTKYCIKNRQAIVTTVRGRIIGYAFFGVVWDYMHLETSYVEPEYRRLGIGSAQLRRRVEIARRMGLKKVLSDCGAGNRVAYAYHLKNGFRRCGYIRRLFGSEDSLVLSKDL